MPTQIPSQSGVFGANELTILEGAVQDAWDIVSKHQPSWAITREEVARQVMACAADGERDKATLIRYAVEKLTGADNDS